MAEINGISNIEKNYYTNPSKKIIEGNSDFSSYLGESKSLDDIFNQAADKYDVPVNLLKAVGKAESSFNAKAVSRCGAQGIMQLMPATAKELGVNDSFDPEQNIMGGAKYISGLMKKYNGDSRLALAAYNAGSGNVKKYGGIPPFTETQNYVKKVMNYAGQELDSEIAAAGSFNQKNSSDYSERTSAALPVSSSSASVQNNLAYLYANTTESIAKEQGSMEELFSYDDYLKFIDLFLNEEKETDTKEDKPGYSANEINYNVPVMNLMKNQKLF